MVAARGLQQCSGTTLLGRHAWCLRVARSTDGSIGSPARQGTVCTAGALLSFSDTEGIEHANLGQIIMQHRARMGGAAKRECQIA